MKNIKKSIHVNAPVDETFDRFVKDIDAWWPKSYTWFENPNSTLKMDLFDSQLCTEVREDGEVVTWGRVVSVSEHDHLELLWLIDPQRNEIAKEHRASRVRITFSQDNSGETDVEITHNQFDNLSAGTEEYYALLDSDDGWMFLLRQFKAHVQRSYQPQAEATA